MKVHEKAKTDLNPFDFKKPNNSGKKNLIALNKEPGKYFIRNYYPKSRLIEKTSLKNWGFQGILKIFIRLLKK